MGEGVSHSAPEGNSILCLYPTPVQDISLFPQETSQRESDQRFHKKHGTEASRLWANRALEVLLSHCQQLQSLNQNQGILEWFGLRRSFKGHLAQPPCRGQGQLQPDQDALSKLIFNVSRDGASATILGNCSSASQPSLQNHSS